MKIIFMGIILLTSIINCQTSENILPTKSQIAWADCEIGVIIHLDISIFKPETFDFNNKETLPNLSVFNPSKLNTDQWIKAAKDAGAKYAILTAKHLTGFTLWPSKVHGYNVGNTPWKNRNGDIVKDFINSCKKYDIKPGLYYNTNINTYMDLGFNQELNAEQQKIFNDTNLKQLKELWTQYGELFEIWFDGGVKSNEIGGIANEVIQLINDCQPNAILFQGPMECRNLIRWIGNEDGRAPYPHWSRADAVTSSLGLVNIPNLHGDPGGKIWCPAEADFPNIKQNAWNGGWLWKANQDSLLFSVDELIDRYYTSVGKNANMLIGMAIDTSGQFPQSAENIFSEFGKELNRLFKNPIASSNFIGHAFELKISDSPQLIKNIVIQEDISKGERVRKYFIEAFVDERWIIIADGISIGHKRIHKIDNLETTKIKLSISEYSEEPIIMNFAVFP
ncbi:MAG: alpha-L-fucosidase [Ignavibacteriae bacterium]|nr:alpha-L-fucosidase [Ignavibacteriota bacterium]